MGAPLRPACFIDDNHDGQYVQRKGIMATCPRCGIVVKWQALRLLDAAVGDIVVVVFVVGTNTRILQCATTAVIREGAIAIGEAAIGAYFIDALKASTGKALRVCCDAMDDAIDKA